MKKYQIALYCAVLAAALFSGRANAQDLQTQITTACQAGGGTVQLPAGLTQQNIPLTLCSSVNLIGKGRGQSELGVCPTTIATNLSLGTLFPITNMNHIHLADFCIKQNGTGGGTAIQLNWGQFVVAERLYIQGPFSNGIVLNPNNLGSTISNHFNDIHITGAGIPITLDSKGLTATTLNNDYFDNVNANSGPNGIGLLIVGGGNVPVINEVNFKGGSFVAPGGTAVWIKQGATRNLKMESADIEGSSVGLNMETGQDGFTFLAGHIASNATNLNIAAGSTRTFATGDFGGAIQRFSLDPFGSLSSGALCIYPAGCDPGNFNAGDGFAIEGSGNSGAFIYHNLWQFNRPAAMASFNFSFLPAVPDGTVVYCPDCTTAPTCAGGGTGEFAKRKHGIWACN